MAGVSGVSGPRVVFTPLMKKRLDRRVLAMLQRALSCFPELRDRTITVGYSRSNLGSAAWSDDAKADPRLTIRLKVKGLTYNTIGHELTHLVQALARLAARGFGSGAGAAIPSGEKQCDVWTLARSSLFCDDAPSYLKLPRAIRENWPRYAKEVRGLCLAAIEKRRRYRFYLRWLEGEIRRLPRRPVAREERQLSLPFG